MSENDRWRQTLHLGYCREELTHVAIHDGTVTDVAKRIIERHAPGAVLESRMYPLGERDWPVRLVYSAVVTLDGEDIAWRHEFRRPDEPWPTPLVETVEDE